MIGAPFSRGEDQDDFSFASSLGSQLGSGDLDSYAGVTFRWYRRLDSCGNRYEARTCAHAKRVDTSSAVSIGECHFDDERLALSEAYPLGRFCNLMSSTGSETLHEIVWWANLDANWPFSPYEEEQSEARRGSKSSR